MSTGVGNILLRAPEPKDTEIIYGYLNDWEVIKTLGGLRLRMSRRDVEDWIEGHRKNQKDMVWVIADKETDVCIGHAGLYEIDHRVRKAEIGVCIGNRDYWGRGIGTLVYASLLDIGFRQLNLHRIETFNLSVNKKVERIKEKLGFKFEGELRDVQFRDGVFINKRIWAILETDWATVDLHSILGQ